MKSCFWVRGYPDNLMKDDMAKVCFSKGVGSKSKSQESKGVPLVIRFHPKFKLIGQLLNKHLPILHMDQEIKNVFMPGPMATTHSACKLSSYLVRTKLYHMNITGITCKKIPCYMGDSACRWFIVKNLKYF